MIVGMTGGIATGKSTVTKILRQIGYPVICADEIAHAVTQKNCPAYKKIVGDFGEDILNKDKTLDRKKIARIVFTDKKKKKKLEKIVHPFVRREIFSLLKKLKKHHRLIFLDIPLLFESGLDRLCTHTICVYSPQKLQLKRLMAARSLTKREALLRLRAQWPLRKKSALATCVLKNTDTVNALKKNLRKILTSLPIKTP